MNIYFAGSIRAGREDVPIYENMIAYLKEIGTVSTEHVGDYSLSIRGQNQLDDSFIHDRDLEWLKNSDIVVAEVTVASLGVGYELATAIQWKIPVIALFRNENNDKQLSAMIKGSNGIKNFEYSNIDEAIKILKQYFQEGETND
ncbi:nucleoside 2-deoxyribosyltransferase [Carnobacterium maltaromaticum]|uniref:nucleoside 2-deoxyribosyltransferase n=1 Tax=Carnobacterium maltaromaticum TaxID=2751 RepID=UPI0039BDCE01